VTVSVLSRQIVRVVVIPAIAVFVLIVLLSFAGPPASASDDAGIPLDEASPALQGRRGLCNDEGYVNGEMPATSTSPPAAPPVATRTPVPIESRGSTCWMSLFAMLLGIPTAAGILGLRGRLR
jgi:hypothetical protein